jgi:hypothetical protein
MTLANPFLLGSVQADAHRRLRSRKQSLQELKFANGVGFLILSSGRLVSSCMLWFGSCCLERSGDQNHESFRQNLRIYGDHRRRNTPQKS